MSWEETLRQYCMDRPKDRLAQMQIARTEVLSDANLINAASDAYRFVRRHGSVVYDRHFKSKFIDSWCQFIINAISGATPTAAASDVQAGNCFDCHDRPTLYLCWHFPEYPLIMERLIEKRIVTVVAKNAAWMQRLHECDLTANFRSVSGRHKLHKHFKYRSSILAMIDYCYEETKSEITPFLGVLCRTPAGIIRRCMLLNYRIVVISCEEGCFIAEEINNRENRDNINHVLTEINSRVSVRISRNPARWLLWPSLASRTISHSLVANGAP